MSTLPNAPAPSAPSTFSASSTPPANSKVPSVHPTGRSGRFARRWRRLLRRLRQGGWRSAWVLTGTGLAVLGLMHLAQPDDSQADLARTLLGLGCVAVIRLLSGPRRGP
ncbi:MAG: hypothetical protein ACK4K3_05780 [Aquabacterium sp.]